jgi:hypothetical protein
MTSVLRSRTPQAVRRPWFDIRDKHDAVSVQQVSRASFARRFDPGVIPQICGGGREHNRKSVSRSGKFLFLLFLTLSGSSLTRG